MSSRRGEVPALSDTRPHCLAAEPYVHVGSTFHSPEVASAFCSSQQSCARRQRGTDPLAISDLWDPVASPSCSETITTMIR